MPIVSVTTTAGDVFFGGENLDSLSFKNGSTTGTIYLRNKQQTLTEVSSTNYEFSLGAGASIGFTRVNDGDGIVGGWRAISDGTVTLEILPVYSKGTRGV